MPRGKKKIFHVEIPCLGVTPGVFQRIFGIQGDLKKKIYRDIPKPTYFAGVSTI
jgi:hypothetical protein